MNWMPRNSRPRPRTTSPSWRRISRSANAYPRKPSASMKGVSAETSNAMICAVNVEPILAPMIIGTVWASVIRPAETKPTSSTVVMVEEFNKAVITAPATRPLNRLEVILARMAGNLAPAIAFRPLVSSCRPNRKRASPAASCPSIPTRFRLARLVGVAGHLAVENAHHRLEEEALALGARVTVVRGRRLHLRHDVVGERFERCASRHREHLRAAYALQLVQPAVRLRDGVAGDEHAVVLHEEHVVVAHHACEAHALVDIVRGAHVGVVVGDVAVEKRRGLARRDKPIVLQHVEGERPGLMRVHDYTRTADAVDRRVNALRRELDHAVAFQRASRFVEDDHVARARLGPVQA